jgi:hypothetical protein
MDWTDDYRAPPSDTELATATHLANAQQQVAKGAQTAAAQAAQAGRLSRADTEEIISQVRQAARSEIDRAADLFSARARAATRDIQPLVTQYTNVFFRWLRLLLGVVAVLLIAYIVFQVIAQESFFNWLGDRIDNLSE